MPGFSKKDQAQLALLVLGHRGKLEKLARLPVGDGSWHLIFSLRLAVLLHRTRADRALPAWRVRATATGYQVDLPAEWLAANPWTAAALSEETQVWRQIGQDYVVKSRASRKAA
jgi:exopolyphosphatase/guanosine-5'-triphosphate,3'-diphosphate pyrophosphatase